MKIERFEDIEVWQPARELTRIPEEIRRAKDLNNREPNNLCSYLFFKLFIEIGGYDMADTEIVQSACGLCSAGCGVLITLENGRPVEIKGDPESPPNRGGLCKIGFASLEYLNHPDRLKYPLKRSGRKGECQWERITREEAFRLAADGLNKIKHSFGPESVKNNSPYTFDKD